MKKWSYEGVAVVSSLDRSTHSITPHTQPHAAGRALRVVGNLSIPDSPSSWRWAVRNLSEHVLASEGNPLVYRMKRGLLRMISAPVWRRLMPRREADVEWADFASTADLIIEGHAGNWIIISESEGRVIRVFPHRWQYLKARWIHSQPAVAAISPAAIAWDDGRLIYVEEYVPGQSIVVHNVESAIAVIHDLWSALEAVYCSRTVVRSLRSPKSRHSRAAAELFQVCGLSSIWEQAHRTPVTHGLIHGDLKPLNILQSDDHLAVIDWSESFSLQPPLFDVLYFLYWIARSHPPGLVADVAFGDTAWLREGRFNWQDQRLIEASLVAFTREMMRRIAKERAREKRRLERRLATFLREVARVLDVS